MKENKRRFRKLITALIILVVVSGPVIAQTSIIYADFETGDLSEIDGSANAELNTTESYNGDNSIQVNGVDGSSSSFFFHITPTQHESFSTAMYISELGTGSQAEHMLRIREPNFGSIIGELGVNEFGNVYYRTDTGDVDTSTSISLGEWHVYEYDNIDYTNQTYDANIYDSGGNIVFSRDSIDFAFSATEIGTIDNSLISDTNQGLILYDDIAGDLILFDDTESNLQIEFNSWMGLNSSQPYTILLNETNTTSGNSNITDVTADSNVTIYNITNTTGFSNPIARVNNSTDTIKSYNETGVVAVNATYDGGTANATNLTVANRNLSNIGILPPGQYISAFLGVDDATGGHNIGSETQWLIFIIIVAAGFGRAFDNDWIGLGLGTLTSILLWVVGFVGIGLMYTVVFFAIFVGILKVRVVNNTSQMSVDINDTRDFRR